ncbi:MAG: helix-turn-helix domain-containing protein [Thermoanaerobaculia bacterium]
MDVVLRLRELRRLRGLSQKDVADRSGIGEKSISSFETGERIASMKLAQLERILHAYGVTLKEFFSERLDRKIAPWDVTPEEEQLEAMTAELKALPKKTRAAIVARMRLMIDAASEMPSIPRTTVPPRPQLAREWQMLTSRN